MATLNVSGVSADRIYLTANTVLTLLDGTDGQVLTLIVTQDSAGGHSLSIANSSGLPSISTTASASTILQLVYDSVTGNWTVPAALGSSGLSIASLALSSAQILALNGTPVQIVGAPGAGKVLVPVFATAQYKFNSLAYANVTDANIVIAASAVLGTDEEPIQFPATDFIDQTSSQFSMVPGSSEVALSAMSNAALVVANEGGSGEFTTGNGTLIVTIWYATVTLS